MFQFIEVTFTPELVADKEVRKETWDLQKLWTTILITYKTALWN